MTIRQWMLDARALLEKSGCPDPAIDARYIAEEVLGLSATELRFEGENLIEGDALRRLNALLSRRAVGEPVQYVLNRADIMGLSFYVDERVLIPRQDTETLIEAAIVALQDRRRPRVLDLCCGSGAIGLSIKSLCPGAEVTLTDISAPALEVARRNAKLLSVSVALRHGDLFDAVRGECFDLIVSNPPYIPHAELEELQPEVRREPALALDGGEDGLDFYRRIARDAGAHLSSGGMLLTEVGAGQAQAVRELFCREILASQCDTGRDLNGIERIVRLTKR